MKAESFAGLYNECKAAGHTASKGKAMTIFATYKLESYVIRSGN